MKSGPVGTSIRQFGWYNNVWSRSKIILFCHVFITSHITAFPIRHPLDHDARQFELVCTLGGVAATWLPISNARCLLTQTTGGRRW